MMSRRFFASLNPLQARTPSLSFDAVIHAPIHAVIHAPIHASLPALVPLAASGDSPLLLPAHISPFPGARRGRTRAPAQGAPCASRGRTWLGRALSPLARARARQASLQR